jgi:hypothetical protein
MFVAASLQARRVVTDSPSRPLRAALGLVGARNERDVLPLRRVCVAAYYLVHSLLVWRLPVIQLHAKHRYCSIIDPVSGSVTTAAGMGKQGSCSCVAAYAAEDDAASQRHPGRCRLRLSIDVENFSTANRMASSIKMPR